MVNLRVLLAEDDPLDAELIIRELRKGGYDPDWHRVESETAFRSRLAQDPPDVIISDHAMPQFSSTEALRCLHDSGLAIPFLVVSHAIGEEEAVLMMRDGAADFLMKDRLGRLAEAVRLALDAERLRRAHTSAQQALVSLNEQLERRVAERTAELQAATHRLEAELNQRNRAEEALQRLNAELEQRVEKRTRAVVASHHRLRALASELTLAEQRERKRLSAELHDYLAQMLALGRMKIGRLRPQLAAVPQAVADQVRELDDLFDKALKYTRSLMAKLSPAVLDELGLPAALRWLSEEMVTHKLTVAVHVSHEQVALPDDQAVLLFQSVRELLINVAKHAGTDRATVTLQVEHDEQLSIEVQDGGQGFDVSLMEGKSPREHFGLLSVRERMEAMGGRLDVTSAVGCGTTVRLSLPIMPMQGTGQDLEAGEGAVGAPVSAAASGRNVALGALGSTLPVVDSSHVPHPAAPASIRVLLVDDHALVRQGLRALLEGYSRLTVVGEAGDGEEGVSLAAQLDPDVVLMDVNMPWMDGIEATKRIKQEWPEMQVVGLSVNNSPQIMESMKAAGAASFVSKEAAGEQLYDTILGAMAGGRSPVRQVPLF